MIFTYCKLRDILVSIHSGGTPSTTEKEYWGGSYKWLSSGETSKRFIADTIDTITERGIKESSTKLANRESVVMACAGQGKTRGQTSFLLDDMYVNQSVIVLNPDKKKVLPLYLFYDLSGRYDELRGGSDASSTRGSITTTSLKALPFRYPSIAEQERIVTTLYAYDNLIDVNNKRIKVLEQMAENLYKEWFVRFRFPGHENAEFENGIPKGWQISRMEDFCYVTDGTHDTPKSTENGVPLVTGKFIEDGEINFDEAYLISEDDHEAIKKRSGLSTGDILFSNIGTVGKSCIVDYQREFSVKNVIIFKPNSFNKALFLYYWLTSPTMQEIFSTQTNGASQQFVGLTFMRRYKIMVPPQTVLSQFEDQIYPIYQLQVLLRNNRKKLIKQRDLLLPRLMSGKLEIK